MGCELCEGDGGRVLWRDEFCRVVRAAVEDHPGFRRVIVNRHVRERLVRVVFACEQALRELLRPDKVNLAGGPARADADDPDIAARLVQPLATPAAG